MTFSAFDPLQLPVEIFARQGQVLEGLWPLASLTRLQDSTHSQGGASSTAVVAWKLRGESRASRVGTPEIWLHLRSSADVPLICQRCLQSVMQHISAERSFRFVHGESTAAELDAQSEDDVLALGRFLDARELTEDELLLSLPLVPRHEVCPQPLVATQSVPNDDAEPEHPFAALAQLKRGKTIG